jgi:hypothetical protein
MPSGPHAPILPEMIRIPAGPFVMGIGDPQVEELVERTDWAQEWIVVVGSPAATSGGC